MRTALLPLVVLGSMLAVAAGQARVGDPHVTPARPYRVLVVIADQWDDPDSLRDPHWIDRWKDKRWIGFNEYCAYLHGRVDVARSAGLTVQFDYDAHYCRHFARNPSRWTLEVSDEYRKQAGAKVTVSVDGKAGKRVLAGPTLITIPPGVGSHRLEICAE